MKAKRSSMVELFRNDFFVVRCDSSEGIVEVTRTNAAFSSQQEAATGFEPMLLCLDGLGRHRYSLLFDARDSVARNDLEYESWYARYRAELIRGFACVAILMKTPVGGLQATRLLPPSNSPTKVFIDPALAWAFVGDPNARPNRPASETRGPASSARLPAPHSETRSTLDVHPASTPKPSFSSAPVSSEVASSRSWQRLGQTERQRGGRRH